MTNRSGLLDAPIEIDVPELSASQQPDTGIIPFARVNIYARLPGYEEIYIENVQIFADTTTDQNLEMIPLSELPELRNKSERFDTPAQNL